MNQIKISQLMVYPVKSTTGTNVSSMQFDAMGPVGDRRWMVVDDQGRFLTQRKLAKMCQIESRLVEQGLTLSAPEMDTIFVCKPKSELIQVVVWRDTVAAQDCGEKAAHWLSDYLDVSCRLVFMPDLTQRLVSPKHAKNGEIVSLADAYPLLIVSTASLERFNSRLGHDVKMDRFRPNIVVTTTEPHEEDRWKRVSIGGLEISLVSPCSRCIVPSINQQSGEKNPQITETLQQYRRQDHNVYFGMNAIHHTTGEIRLGDELIVLEKQSQQTPSSKGQSRGKDV